MKQGKIPKNIKLYTVFVFLAAFIIFNAAAHLQVQHHKDEEEIKASYTAEETVRRMESQLNKYVARSEILKKIIESGYEVNDKEFQQMAKFMIDQSHVIKAVELAKDGAVSKIYPLKGNEEADGLDMLTDKYRKGSANLAKNSGKYTIAGPYDLVQGGKGVLLFDPIYQKSGGKKQFWGFSILVIDWNLFTESLDLDKLEEASYYYKIWKKDVTTGHKISLAQCKNPVLTDALQVACDVPNDTWYFDIEPKDGWFSKSQLLMNSMICLLLSFLIAVVYYQHKTRRYKEHLYTQKIQKTADEAKAANLAKTSFLSRMSHDIRTPLNGIIGLLKIDEKHPDNIQLIKENRQKMLVAANHLLELINDVLQMNKLESGEVILSHELINLNELGEETITILEQRAANVGVTLEHDKASDELMQPYVYGSPLHIRQLFLNIYGNCIKYNKKGGKIKTTVIIVEEKEDTAIYRWVISDTGIGMSEEFLEHIFEPFVQEHSDARSVYHGTGIGMSIVKTLTEKMGGTIEVSSTKDVGSTFVVTLPFERAKKEQIQEKQKADKDIKEYSIKGASLLLAEDNELNAEIAQILLEDEGASITLAKDGQEAIDIFGASEPGTYDAILMDVMMPKVDGLQATKIIRSMKRKDAGEIPIIAMTANAYDEDVRKCIDAGMNAHLAKPLQMQEVIATIAQQILTKKRNKAPNS